MVVIEFHSFIEMDAFWQEFTIFGTLQHVGFIQVFCAPFDKSPWLTRTFFGVFGGVPGFGF